MKEPCKCGCGLPVGEGKEYVNQAHKQRAYRSRKRNENRALSNFVSGELVAMLGSDNADQIFSMIDDIPTDAYHLKIDKALCIIIDAWRNNKLENPIAHHSRQLVR